VREHTAITWASAPAVAFAGHIKFALGHTVPWRGESTVEIPVPVDNLDYADLVQAALATAKDLRCANLFITGHEDAQLFGEKPISTRHDVCVGYGTLFIDTHLLLADGEWRYCVTVYGEANVYGRVSTRKTSYPRLTEKEKMREDVKDIMEKLSDW
jgi:hypothetical protein